MNAARYLWQHYYGRLALLSLIVGGIGLATGVWLPFLYVAALWLPKGIRETIARQTPTYRRAGIGPDRLLRAPKRVTPRRPDSEQSELTFRSPDGGR